MKKNEFEIGKHFFIGEREWRCTDIGTRTIVAIRVDEPEVRADPSWLNGPPYGVPEVSFDEYDIEGCHLEPDTDK